MTATETDELLMQQTQQGRRDSAGVLVRRYASALLTFVDRMIGNRHISEELVQDVFLAVWHKRHQYRFPRSFQAWLYTIAHNCCRHYYRRRRSFDSIEESSPASTDVDPTELALRAEQSRMINEAVVQLPEQQRCVLVLRVWNGMSYSEIAEVIQRSEATARSHMHHALANLATKIQVPAESREA